MADQDPWGKPGQQGQSNNQNKPKDEQPSPWGNSSKESQNEQNPPDIEEVFSNLLKKLGGKKTGQNNQHHPQASIVKLLPIALLVGAIVWGISGFYTIKEAERGIVTRFGKFNHIVPPGLNWKPTFIDHVIPVNVEQVRELRTQGSMLTKDENMVKVEMTVQYRVQNPAKYLFNVTNADNSLNQATDSALRYVIGHMTMDDILTTGRAMVREDTWKTLNEIIKPYDMGIEIIDVNFQSARPPEEVKAAFDDAIKAQEDEQRYIREAEAYAREQEPMARGDAQRTVESATAYKVQVVLDAQGEVDRFKQLLPEFKAAPDITRQRMYLQTMEKVMAKTPKIMMDGNGNNLTVLPLDKILQGKNPEKASVLPATAPKSAVKNDDVSHQPIINTTTQQSDNDDVRQGRFN